MHGWRLAILIPSYSREAATPASSLASRSRSSNRFAVSTIARAEEAARAASSHLLECCRAERSLRVQCRCVRGFGRVRRRVQLPLLELPCADRLGLLALGRDRAREAESDQGRGLVD